MKEKPYFSALIGNSLCYLVPGKNGFLLIDAGFPGKGRQLIRFIEKRAESVRAVKLIIATHCHFDHVGNLAETKALSGAPVVMHRADAPFVEAGIVSIPRSISRYAGIVARLGSGLRPHLSFPKTKPDILIDADFDLSAFGFAVRILHTPGHTEGSISVLLESGECFVGDTCFGIPPWRRTAIPPFADKPEYFAASYKKLADSPARVFLPGHGLPLSREKILRSLEKSTLDPQGART
jgi:glyoxylase-like metal-dependent hydrolase (beta-lactamase superfamily II)